MEFNRLDVSAKELIWDDPAAWLERYGVGPPGPVEVIESEVTFMTAAIAAGVEGRWRSALPRRSRAPYLPR